uniref:Glycosyl transferase n=1 Tax=Vibrio parahaemolyticus TaxID=670 RepID=A0A5P4S6W7_VIBPH|nr:glycosyl transferase [Vibrio parahaemolyticus]
MVDMANYFSLKKNVTVVSLTDDVFRASELNENVDLRVYDVKKKKLAIFKLLKLFWYGNFSVVHSHMPISILLSRFLMIFSFFKRRNLKLINSFHNTVTIGSGLKSKLIFRLIKMTKNIPTLTTNVSIDSTNQLKKLNLVNVDKTVCLSNGVDFNSIRSAINNENNYFKHSKYKVCSVASLTEQKGLDLGIESVVELYNEGVPIEYLIVGDGEQLNYLRSIISKKNAESYIRLFGKSKDVANIINQADVFFLPSRWEGFGLVILEAIALKKKIVATKTQGPLEILGYDYTYLCDLNIDDFVEKLNSIRAEADFNYNAGEIESKYSINRMLQRIDAYYE